MFFERWFYSHWHKNFDDFLSKKIQWKEQQKGRFPCISLHLHHMTRVWLWIKFFVHMHAEHQCSTLVTWSNLKEWCRATHKPPKTMKRLTTYGDVKIWAWFCLVLLAVLLMTLERQHKSCVRGSPHFILGHYDKSVAHCKNDALSLLVPDEMWPLLLLWLWYLTNNNPTLILQKFAGWTHYNSQLTTLLK